MAATTLALAAGLTAMAASFAGSDGDGNVVDPDALRVRERAEGLRQRATDLADADGDAYARVLAAGDPEERRRAFAGATDVPLEVVEVAREVAQLAGPLALHGRPALRGDAQVAALLAVAAARAASHLVRCNVEAGGLDPALVERAERWTREASRIVGEG